MSRKRRAVGVVQRKIFYNIQEMVELNWMETIVVFHEAVSVYETLAQMLVDRGL